MSKFNSILENHLNTTNLLRVRIKHDPANEAGQLSDYVGYVLEEDGHGNIVAIVPSMGPDSISLGPDQYLPDAEGCGIRQDDLAGFKKHVVNYLMARGYHDSISDHMEHIIHADNVKMLENILIQSCGCNAGAILDLYRDFVQDV